MASVTMKKGAETLASLAYSRDPAGQIESLIGKGLPGAEEESFSYDEDERLTKAGASEFRYDAANNLTEAPGTNNAYDKAGEIESATGATFTFDKEGQRTKETPSSGPATTYSYSQAGDLTAIERPEEGETPSISESFGYDGTGLLASRTVGLTTTHLVWDLSESPELVLSDGQDSYIYGPSGLPVEQITSGGVPTYLHHDEIGSTRLLTNGSGEASGTFSYGPYGQLTGKTGTATTALGFAGQYTLGQSGLQYLRARFYDPATAQFLTVDPAVEITGQPYTYAAGDPLAFFDRTGRECESSSVSIEGFHVATIPGSINPECLLEGLEETPEKAEEIVSSPVAGPAIALGCTVWIECDAAKGIAAGIAAATTLNARESASNPCFNFFSSELESVIASVIGGATGAAVDGGLEAAGDAAGGLSPVGVRLLHLWGDAGGAFVELAHAIGSGR